jgi:DNA (cytosine-5)-methyltransferase 1
MNKNVIKTAELFAGVGGFRLGLEKSNYKIVWSNQWEPSTKTQHASMVYEARFGTENHSNEDIATVDINEIPDHDLLVGGFPCQDYSVATTLKNSKGLIGKKGVLWWSIYRILTEKRNKPKYLFLENVDRLLKSPAKQKGRDFSIILKSLDELGYAVEWRVVNAAEYGMPQRRRRVFFLGYHKSTDLYKSLSKTNKLDWILNTGVIATAFPTNNAINDYSNEFELKGSLVDLSNSFNKNGKTSPFLNSGVAFNGKIVTTKTLPHYKGQKTFLGDILQNGEVTDEFFINKNDFSKWAAPIRLPSPGQLPCPPASRPRHLPLSPSTIVEASAKGHVTAAPAAPDSAIRAEIGRRSCHDSAFAVHVVSRCGLCGHIGKS